MTEQEFQQLKASFNKGFKMPDVSMNEMADALSASKRSEELYRQLEQTPNEGSNPWLAALQEVNELTQTKCAVCLQSIEWIERDKHRGHS